jgi:hypothetical protein
MASLVPVLPFITIVLCKPLNLASVTLEEADHGCLTRDGFEVMVEAVL